MTNQTQPVEAGFLRLREVLKLLPIGRSTWWAGIKEGRYPKPVRLSRRTVGWRRADIRKLLEQISR